MAKRIITLCNYCTVAVLLLLTFTGCKQPQQQSTVAEVTCGEHNCSSSLPSTKTEDTLTLFPASAEMLAGNDGMVLIDGGKAVLGAIPGDTTAQPDELPQHPVVINSFWMDATEVTNKQFRKFVEATNYVTTAERLNPKGSLVFMPRQSENGKELSWWSFVDGADWKHPYGPNSSIDTMDNFPVVHVSWFDAVAYASWAGKRLPSETEWEFAARSGATNSLFPWGNANPEKEKRANIFQGNFPALNNGMDGFAGPAPVASFPPTNNGIYDLSGNVWEWCSDKYHSRYYAYRIDNNITDTTGPVKSYDSANRFEELRVIRGGSFMCNSSYCTGYRASARNKTSPSTSLLNVGFRCVRDAK